MVVALALSLKSYCVPGKSCSFFGGPLTVTVTILATQSFDTLEIGEPIGQKRKLL